MSSSSLFACCWIFVPILFALIAANYVLFMGMAPPPSDYGSGQMFDDIAPRYDLVNRAMAMRMDIGWRQTMVNTIKGNVKEGAMILDMATGTADVALLLAKTIPKATIVGMDPSHNMLKVGQDKVDAQERAKQITLRQGGVEELGSTFEPSSFDAATMAFGIRNVVDREDALCQLHTVLKNDATLCILEFSEPDPAQFGIMGYLARLFIRHIAPMAGGILSGKPREYLHLQNSIQNFPAPEEFGKLMEQVECVSATDDEAEGDQAMKSSPGNHYKLQSLQHINFGSVQLYTAKAIK